MKKFLLATVALIALGATASAADLPARTYTKAPMLAPVMNWTGFYIFGGGGYGVMDSDQNPTAGGFDSGSAQRFGGHGYFGTAGAGFDYQFAPKWVVGVFGDAQFGDIKSTLSVAPGLSGNLNLNTSWAAGARLGYLVAPNVLSYVNAGYSNAEFGGSTQASFGNPAVGFTRSFSRDGWFVGGGVENSLDIFGVSFPGLFMKTEYRVAQYDRTSVDMFDTTGAPTPLATNFRPIVQTVSTSLVYRFNYGR